ncbi:MAG: transcriptional regulator, LacI family [Microbacteriaceae bacterium]|jgi:LacI family transcriptional regulator|nr:transcriptional regulator, LacI family [Microbacteriaceae bacterium]
MAPKDVDPVPILRAVTLTDVAKAAGVSVATASKALNGRDQVKAETRDRVHRVAEKLSFQPNALARGLLAGRSGTVGLLTNDLEGRFSIPVLMGAEDAVGADRMSVFLCDARGDSIREQYHVQALLSRRVDGLIVVGSSTDARPSLGELPVPVVYAYAPSENPDDLSLISDNVGGGRLAAEHLIRSGRTRIAHITGDPTYAAARDRATGVTAALEDAGLPLVGDRVMFGEWNEGWGRGATRMLFANHPEIDAIVAGSDQIARGVLDSLHELDVGVPRDVAVISFDNWAILATNSRPQLTSVDLRLEQLGRLAAQRLLEAIGGTRHSGVEALACRVVTRESTMPVG